MNDDTFVVLPEINEYNEEFWTGGKDEELRIFRCQEAECRHWFHPPRPCCPKCLSRNVEAESTSGIGKVFSYTINKQEWNPTRDHPYVYASIELADQDGLRVTSNVRDCPPQDVEIGMDVKVYFENTEDVYLPMFRPRR